MTPNIPDLRKTRASQLLFFHQKHTDNGTCPEQLAKIRQEHIRAAHCILNAAGEPFTGQDVALVDVQWETSVKSITASVSYILKWAKEADPAFNCEDDDDNGGKDDDDNGGEDGEDGEDGQHNHGGQQNQDGHDGNDGQHDHNSQDDQPTFSPAASPDAQPMPGSFTPSPRREGLKTRQFRGRSQQELVLAARHPLQREPPPPTNLEEKPDLTEYKKAKARLRAASSAHQETRGRCDDALADYTQAKNAWDAIRLMSLASDGTPPPQYFDYERAKHALKTAKENAKKSRADYDTAHTEYSVAKSRRGETRAVP